MRTSEANQSIHESEPGAKQQPDSSVQRVFDACTDQSGRQITLRSVDWDRAPSAATREVRSHSGSNSGLARISESLKSYRIENNNGPDSPDGASVSVVHCAPVASCETEVERVTQFQLCLRPEQLARLWLREPSLKPTNVFAWSEVEQQWVPALKVPEIAAHLTRARIESVRMWSVLCASQTPTNAPGAPRKTRFSLRRFSAVMQRHFYISRTRTGEMEAAAIARTRVRAETHVGPKSIIGRSVASLMNWVAWLSNCALRQVKRNMSLVSLFLYFSISSLASGIVVARLVGMQRHGAITANMESVVPFTARPDSEIHAANPGFEQRDTATTLARSQSFNASAAEVAVNEALRNAKACSLRNVHGKLALTFASNGRAEHVTFTLFSGNSNQRGCLSQYLGQIALEPFTGGPATVQRNIRF